MQQELHMLMHFYLGLILMLLPFCPIATRPVAHATVLLAMAGLCWSQTSSSFLPAYAAQQAQTVENTAPAQPSVNLQPQTAQFLKDSSFEYKNQPDEASFGRYWTFLKDQLLLGELANLGFSPTALIGNVPGLTELKVKIHDLGNHSRLFAFPHIKESHSIIYQAPAGRSVILPLPQNIALIDARVVGGAHIAAPTEKAAAKGKAIAHAKPAPAAASNRLLILIGNDRINQTVWLKAYKINDGWLAEAPEAFASLPVYFSQNVTGRASVSGNDIVLTIVSPQTPAPQTISGDTSTKPAIKTPASSGYKVVLKYSGGKYLLSGKAPDDAPAAIAMSFVQAIAQGKPDVAKAWLQDPKLISIPRYLNLIGRSSPPMRIVPMTGFNTYRYRVITGNKNDLIVEVARIATAGRLRGQLAVRGLFVAPQDALAQKMTGTVVLPASPAPSAQAETKVE